MGVVGSYRRLLGAVERVKSCCQDGSWPTAGGRRRQLATIRRINADAESLQRVGDGELTSRANDLRQLVDGRRGVADQRVITAGFALVKEAARRTLGTPHYDVQLLGGLALTSGAIAEMQTGEGKTLTSTLPVFIHALAGQGVHVATVNSYLAQRDFETLRPIHELLGVSVGLSSDGATNSEKQAAYQCDITFSTGYELGFDFLRDEVTRRRLRGAEQLGTGLRQQLRGACRPDEGILQRSQALAVIDEVDSVLIDEANTPLILSGTSGATADPHAYIAAAQVAGTLHEGRDFRVDRELRTLVLTQVGQDRLYAQPMAAKSLRRPWASYIEQALRARHLYQRDIDYVVAADAVKIVDQYTGRIFDERNWRDGLHQAIETKEGVTITDERHSIARVSRQRFFRLYEQLCGMSGTATGHDDEFRQFRLPVVPIPLRRPSRRFEEPTLYFPSADAKWDAIAHETAARHHAGQPVLIGSRTIANSRVLADKLQAAGLPFQLLNGLQDADESELISRAGGVGMITIATNMAGRGTDIKPSMAALEAGGLHVIAAERHDSRRIDRQLIGRAARQSDPGSCRFFVSADDELLVRFDAAFARRLRQHASSSGMARADFDHAVDRLQQHTERESRAQRQRLMRQELWLNDVLNVVS